MELKMKAQDEACGLTLDEMREFVGETQDWPGETWLDCYIPSEKPGKLQVAALMGLYAGENMNCPRCKTELRGEPVNHSLSRVDNTTRICSGCGNEEAIFDHFFPGKDLPPLDQRIVSGRAR